jgi:predicted RNA binding protein YcfA (HicA-like mRNA interferase family)
MPRDKREVEKALQSKGFVKKEGDHHYFVYHSIEGKKSSIFTKTSHTPKMRDIPDNLLAQMARQCKLTKGEFERLVDCPMSQTEYESKVLG